MSTIKVSALPAKTVPTGAEELLINDGGTSKKITVSNLPDTTYSVGDGGLTTKDFTTTLKNKLDGIETSADVTDATNVTAAGALMDSELAGLAAVKATTGTFLTADQTKLDGIETSATADQTNLEIKTAYEANADTNEFSDAEQTKLATADEFSGTSAGPEPEGELGIKAVAYACAVEIGAITTGQEYDADLQTLLESTAAATSFDLGDIDNDSDIDVSDMVDALRVSSGADVLGDATYAWIVNYVVPAVKANSATAHLYYTGYPGRYSTNQGGVVTEHNAPMWAVHKVLRSDGTWQPANTLYHDDAAVKLTTESYGVDVTGTVVADELFLGDGKKAMFGDGNDLQIYHDGSNTHIVENGTGAFLIKTNGAGIYLKTVAGDMMATFLADSSANLYHNNSPKLATTSSGIDVTGESPVLRITDTTNSASWTTGQSTGKLEFYTSDPSGNAPYDTAFIESVNTLNNGTLPDGSLVFGTAAYNVVGGAVERLRIDSAGKVGIGTSSPDGGLHLKSTGNGDVYVERNAGAKIHVQAQSANGKIGTASNHALGFNTNATTRMTIDTAGNVGVGTSSPLSQIDCFNSGGSELRLSSSNTSDYGELIFSSNNSSYAGYGASISGDGKGIGLDVGQLIFKTGHGATRTERLRILSTGGITFNGDTAQANALDDYEEGTWTPTLSFGGGATGIAYYEQKGKYTKVGNRVFFDLFIALSSKGTSTGTAKITLPYSAADDWAASGHEAAFSLGLSISMGTIDATGMFQGAVVFFNAAGSNSSGSQNGEFSNGSNFRVSGAYKVA